MSKAQTRKLLQASEAITKSIDNAVKEPAKVLTEEEIETLEPELALVYRASKMLTARIVSLSPALAKRLTTGN